MERLTKKDKYGIAEAVNLTTINWPDKLSEIVGRLASYEDTGFEPEEIEDLQLEVATLKTIEAMYDGLGKPDHLRELVQAYADGRLVVLPAKTVFELTWDAGESCDHVCPISIDGIGCCDFCDNGVLVIRECPCRQEHILQIGKTVFLTREEAETALQKEKP